MFKNLMSAEALARFEAHRAEIRRLYGLTNEWLAHALLKLARDAQSATPQHQPDRPTYDSRLIWGIIPELARRLGTVSLRVKEIDWEIRELSDYELRCRIGYTLANIGDSDLPGWSILSADEVNGNPVVFGIDRICAGRLGNTNDPLTKKLESIATVRSSTYAGIWTPDILTPRDRAEFSPRDNTEENSRQLKGRPHNHLFAVQP